MKYLKKFETESEKEIEIINICNYFDFSDYNIKNYIGCFYKHDKFDQDIISLSFYFEEFTDPKDIKNFKNILLNYGIKIKEQRLAYEDLEKRKLIELKSSINTNSKQFLKLKEFIKLKSNFNL